MLGKKIDIKIPYAQGRKHLSEELSLDDLNRLSEPIIDKAVESIWDALEKADLKKEDIDLIILAGGSSQLPGVYKKIYEIMKIRPRIIPKNLMLAISYGAALYQREIFNYPKVRREVRKLGYSLGIFVDDGGRKTFKVLLNHDQVLPAKYKHTYPIDEDQTEVSIDLVMQYGKQTKRLKQRTLKLSEKASSIVVEVTVTENRLIELTAYDPNDKNNRSIIQVDRQSMSDSEISKKRRKLGIESVTNELRKNGQPCIGIDLGTTTTELAYTNRSSEAELKYMINPDSPSFCADYCFPSVVYYKDSLSNPEVANREACDAIENANLVDKVCKNFKIADRNRNLITVEDEGVNVGVGVKDLSAVLLGKVWSTAANTFDTMDIRNAVVTVPAAFDFDECQDTYEAAKLAGIENVTLIDEPTAAYLYYSHVQGIDDRNIENVLVFDFGGGTADVAVLDIKNNNYSDNTEYKDCLYSVLGVSGQQNCGGHNIDEAITNEIRNRFEEKNSCKMSPVAVKRLKEMVEEAKIELSKYYNEMGEL